ncbi:FAD-dependent oxidoreductase [Nonomuraea sp. NPDC050022]|uniref:FAD-dependent oxidoreductase n=1 Tax=Nonomuraea sp. NPDC050022 TaxID=3364358 RepID=UPI0037B5EEEC
MEAHTAPHRNPSRPLTGRFQYIIRTAYTMFKACIGKGFGVSECDNYSVNATSGIEVVHDRVPGLLPQREYLRRLPFEGHNTSGCRYRTLLVEPPIFIPRLERDLRARGVTFVNRRFINSADVLTSLTQKVIINCTGLGAKELWNDSEMLSLRGQLAMLRPQLNIHHPRNERLVDPRLSIST